tara:strand:- start:522 stop:809 length:288 start_codon:yes stop_codon:yes gene_type:complete
MINFTTKKEYTGQNIETLDGLGSEFCTYKQAIKHFDISGKLLKGAKACAKLINVSEQEEVDKKTGSISIKKKTNYFWVFEKNHLIETIKSNGGVA